MAVFPKLAAEAVAQQRFRRGDLPKQLTRAGYGAALLDLKASGKGTARRGSQRGSDPQRLDGGP